MRSRKPILSIMAAMGALLTVGLLVTDAAPASAASRWVNRYNRSVHRRRGRVYRRARILPRKNDLDRDGIRNKNDRDKDNDGIRNGRDKHPKNPLRR